MCMCVVKYVILTISWKNINVKWKKKNCRNEQEKRRGTQAIKIQRKHATCQFFFLYFSLTYVTKSLHFINFIFSFLYLFICSYELQKGPSQTAIHPFFFWCFDTMDQRKLWRFILNFDDDEYIKRNQGIYNEAKFISYREKKAK